MKRITIEVSDELGSLMEQAQARRDISESEIVRDALEAYLGARPTRRRIPFAALGRSEHTDISQRVDEILEADWGRYSQAAPDVYLTTAKQVSPSPMSTPEGVHPGGTTPPLVRRLDAIAASIARGRTFEDSTPAIRAAREGDMDTP